MAIFIGTLIVVSLCCLALGLGLICKGKPLEGGCNKRLPRKLRCIGCPRRREAVQRGEAKGGPA